MSDLARSLVARMEAAGLTPRTVSRYLWQIGLEHEECDHYLVSETYMRNYWCGRWDIDGCVFLSICADLLGIKRDAIVKLLADCKD